MFAFLVDSSFVIYHNSPTKTPLRNFPCRLISPPLCFEAETAEECYQHLENLHFPSRAKSTVMEAIEILRADVLTDTAYSMFTGLDSANLFAVLSGSFSQLTGRAAASVLTTLTILLVLGIIVWLFQQHISLFNAPAYEAHIQDVLQKWSLFWSFRSDRPHPGPRQRNGFFEHADEYRRFALGLLKLRHQEYRQLQLQSAQATIVPLQKFDETSMDQVANLLDLVQSLEL